jgi:hypothetical protein
VSRIWPRDVLWFAERLYHILLFVYPAEHRRAYGSLMAQLFRDLGRDAYRKHGLTGLMRLWSRVLVDTAVSATVEHLHALQEGGHRMTRRQHGMVLSLAGLPLGLGMLLYLINPAFVGQVFAPNAAQPVGWMMAAAVLVMAGAAYVVQRRIIVLAQSSNPSGPAVRGRMSRIAWSILLGPFRSMALNGHREKGFLFACSVLFLVCPAALLVLFGPAIMTVLNAGLYP